MRTSYLIAAITTLIAAGFHFYTPSATMLRVCIGHTFAQVVQASSFPVLASSDLPSNDKTGFGATWVREPAVSIQFDDPQFGFKLPPTTFAAIGYMHNVVDTITTSPMLKTLSFKQTLTTLAYLQNVFQQRGWIVSDESQWFDLSDDGGEILHSATRHSDQWISLRAPNKYSMFFGLRCVEHCDSKIGLDRYLIDLSIGRDRHVEIKQFN